MCFRLQNGNVSLTLKSTVQKFHREVVARDGDLGAVSIQRVFEVWEQVRPIICEESIVGEEKRAEDRIL